MHLTLLRPATRPHLLAVGGGAWPCSEVCPAVGRIASETPCSDTSPACDPDASGGGATDTASASSAAVVEIAPKLERLGRLNRGCSPCPDASACLPAANCGTGSGGGSAALQASGRLSVSASIGCCSLLTSCSTSCRSRANCMADRPWLLSATLELAAFCCIATAHWACASMATCRLCCNSSACDAHRYAVHACSPYLMDCIALQSSANGLHASAVHVHHGLRASADHTSSPRTMDCRSVQSTVLMDCTDLQSILHGLQAT